jgi:hypothetical protein
MSGDATNRGLVGTKGWGAGTCRGALVEMGGLWRTLRMGGLTLEKKFVKNPYNNLRLHIW